MMNYVLYFLVCRKNVNLIFSLSKSHADWVLWSTWEEEKDGRCVEFGAQGDDRDGGAESRGRRETR